MLFSLLRQYLKPYRGAVTAIIALQLVATLASLKLPSLNADIIDNGVIAGDTHYIIRIGLLMLGISLLQVMAAVSAVYLGARTAMRCGRDLRNGVFTHVQTYSAREVGQIGAPSLITRTTNDVQQVQMVVLMTFTIMVMAPIMLVGGLIMALQQDVGLTALLLVIVPVLVICVGLILIRMVPAFRSMQKRIDVINGVMREQITGIRVIRAFVREDYEGKRFGRANGDLYDVSLRAGRLMALMFPTVVLIINLATLAVMWFGGGRIDSGEMQMGSLTAFLSYLMFILMAIMMSTMIFMMIPRAAVSAERLQEVLQLQSSVVPPAQPTTITERHGVVAFNQVEMKYSGAEDPVLSDVSFVAKPGGTTAIIGSTGAGKTSLINLIPRLFDATGGTVSIDGVDVRQLALQDLWSMIGLVPQKPYLFSGTIASNVRYGKADATDAEVWEALEIAQAGDFVRELPEGLEAPISQGGTNVSGGQRQRLAIARALVGKPSVYLFDDSFSALDYTTDRTLREALVPIIRESTMIIVAQRVATIRHAQQIIVLDAGRIVGRGTHDELLASNQTYQEIVYSQLSAEEATA